MEGKCYYTLGTDNLLWFNHCASRSQWKDIKHVFLTWYIKHKIPENPQYRMETHSSGHSNDSNLWSWCLMVHKVDPKILWLQMSNVHNSVPTQPVLYQVCVFRIGQFGGKVIHHLCTQFVFFAFGNLDRTLNNEVYDCIDIEVLVYYAPPAPTTILVPSLCFSL